MNKRYGIIEVDKDSNIKVYEFEDREVDMAVVQNLINPCSEHLIAVIRDVNGVKIAAFYDNSLGNENNINRFGTDMVGDNRDICPTVKAEKVYGSVIFTGVDFKNSAPSPVGLDLDSPSTQELITSFRTVIELSDDEENEYGVIIINSDSSIELKYLNHKVIFSEDLEDMISKNYISFAVACKERFATILGCNIGNDIGKPVSIALLDRESLTEKGDINYLGSYLMADVGKEPKFLRGPMLLVYYEYKNEMGFPVAMDLNNDLLEIYKKLKYLSLEALSAKDIHAWFNKRHKCSPMTKE